jgi:membrane-associated protease RseP (regulator of RpoE activity)
MEKTMLRKNFVPAWVALGLSFTLPGFAQTPGDEAEVRYRELEQARTEMEAARRRLEEAARTIAVQARVLPDMENVEPDRGIGVRNFVFLGGYGRLGATIVDADTGALVTALTPGGGAEEAGIRVGDVIQSIEGVAVADADVGPSEGVVERLREVEPGATVAVVVERAGQSLDFEVQTAEGPAGLPGLARSGRNALVLANPDAQGSSRFLVDGTAPFVPNLEIVRTLGFASSPWGEMELVVLSEELGRYFDTSEGLLVVRGPEDDAIDIRDGDVILAISGRTPNSPEHAIRILSSFEAGETIEFSIMRDGRRRTIEYSIPASNARVRPVPVTD